MGITLHLSGLIAVILLTIIGLRCYGRLPSARGLALGLAAAVPITMLLISFTTVLHREGNSSRLPFLFLLGAWAILSCLQPPKRAALATVALFLCFLALGIHHLYLATSPDYTDNPGARLRTMAHGDQSRAKRGQKPLPPADIRPAWHTWLTGLYIVRRFTCHAP